jgi:hypothetical protein
MTITETTYTDLEPTMARQRLAAYWDAVHKVEEATADLDEAKANLVGMLDNDASEGRLEGRVAFTYREVAGGDYLDSKKLRESYPDIYSAFTRPRAGHYALKVKP